jgi:hypothetical protein
MKIVAMSPKKEQVADKLQSESSCPSWGWLIPRVLHFVHPQQFCGETTEEDNEVSLMHK